MWIFFFKFNNSLPTGHQKIIIFLLISFLLSCLAIDKFLKTHWGFPGDPPRRIEVNVFNLLQGIKKSEKSLEIKRKKYIKVKKKKKTKMEKKEKIEQLFLEMPRIDVVYISFYVFFFIKVTDMFVVNLASFLI